MPKHNVRDEKGRFKKAEEMVEKAYEGTSKADQPEPRGWAKVARFYRNIFGHFHDDKPFGSY